MPLYRMVQLPCLFAPLAVWLLFLLFRRRRYAWGRAFFVAWFASYVLLVMSVPLFDYFLKQEIDRFPNQEQFTSAEEAARFHELEDMFSNDVGRNMAACTGIPIMLVWTAMNFLVLAPVDWLVRWSWGGVRLNPPSARGEVAQEESPISAFRNIPNLPP